MCNGAISIAEVILVFKVVMQERMGKNSRAVFQGVVLTGF
jgi:hypothetical protein